MKISWEKLGQKKAVIGLVTAGGVVLLLIVVAVITRLPASNDASKAQNKQQPTALQNIEADNARLQQTLDREKTEREKAHQAIDAPQQYQKLAD